MNGKAINALCIIGDIKIVYGVNKKGMGIKYINNTPNTENAAINTRSLIVNLLSTLILL